MDPMLKQEAKPGPSNDEESINFEIKPDPSPKPATASSTSSEGDENDFIQLDSINKELMSDDDDKLSSISSPPKQVMTRSDPSETNPKRIPSSIFAPRSNNADWSITSNESLFSINMGNNSLNLKSPSGSGTPVTGTPVTGRHHGFKPGSVLSEMSERSSMDELGAGPSTVIGLDSKISISERSDGSMNSKQSFAFPILNGSGQPEPKPKPKPKPEPELPSSSNADPSVQSSPDQHDSEDKAKESSNTNAGSTGSTGGPFSCFPCCK